MDERQFIEDVWDILQNNTQYITIEQFREKYADYFVEIDLDARQIRLMDDHNEWHLSLRKVWCDETQAK